MTTGVKRRVVLDAGPVLRYLQGIEPGASAVRDLLSEAKSGRSEVLMSEVNVAEVGRQLREVHSETGLDLLLALRNAGVAIRPGSDDILREVIAARLPLADAFAYATAKVVGARLWTTDHGDFKGSGLEKTIPITFFPLARGKA